jgi:cyanophycinase
MAGPDFLCVGEAFPLAEALRERVGLQADVVVVPIAAAFTGPAEAAIAIAHRLPDQRVEGLVVTDRESAQVEHFSQRVRACDAVIVPDGSPLHLRTVLRGTSLLEALKGARLIVTIGSVSTVFGDPMIDPRGGAPTTGLGLFADRVITVEAPTLARSVELLGTSALVTVVSPAAGWERRGGVWSEI